MHNKTLSHTFFSVKKQYSFIIDDAVLFDFYKPMIGIAAANLYVYLANEVNIQLQKPSKTTLFTEFLVQYEMSESDFSTNRKKLEAVGLLTSFFSLEKNQYYFIVNQILSPTQFFANNKFVSLLKSKLSPAEYEKLIYVYTNTRPFVADITDISENFEILCDNKQLFTVDYDGMVKLISAKIKSFFAFNDSSKAIIDKYAADLNTVQILDFILNSLIEKDNYYTIDNEKLLNVINVYFSVESINTTDTKHQIVRNTNIFRSNNNVSSQEKQEIFASYKNISTLDFISHITKQDLTIEQCNFVSQALKECPKDVLNMMFDYYYAMKKPGN
jgi:replication initiation and membrane attachment protein DnaB